MYNQGCYTSGVTFLGMAELVSSLPPGLPSLSWRGDVSLDIPLSVASSTSSPQIPQSLPLKLAHYFPYTVYAQAVLSEPLIFIWGL